MLSEVCEAHEVECISEIKIHRYAEFIFSISPIHRDFMKLVKSLLLRGHTEVCFIYQNQPPSSRLSEAHGEKFFRKEFY